MLMLSLFKSSLKASDYNIVYQPNPDLKLRKRRFLVSINQLSKYIGQTNANKAIRAAISLELDHIRLKYRKFGIIDIYLK